MRSIDSFESGLNLHLRKFILPFQDSFPDYQWVHFIDPNSWVTSSSVADNIAGPINGRVISTYVMAHSFLLACTPGFLMLHVCSNNRCKNRNMDTGVGLHVSIAVQWLLHQCISWQLLEFKQFVKIIWTSCCSTDSKGHIAAATYWVILSKLTRVHGPNRNVRMILVRGSMLPCRLTCLRRRKFWKIDYEVVHSAFLNICKRYW